MAQSIVLTNNLKKYFPTKKGPIKAVDGVNLEVEQGEIFGFLGPNGAGKTTFLRILTTLMPPDSGTARVADLDTVKNQQAVRRSIGYVGQSGGSDNAATGRENLILQGRLYDMTADEAQSRAEELIKVLDLSEFADRIVSTYSGGQRRRLDVALGMMNKPKILFLDEPTTGLDPQNRANLWTQIQKLQKEGTTIFLTTHYLEEADALSDRVAIIDHGKIVALGTPKELKRQVAGDSIIIGLKDTQTCSQVCESLKTKEFIHNVSIEDGHIRIYVEDGPHALPEIIRLFDQENIRLNTISLSEPSLDDVFLAKTGRTLRDTEAAETSGVDQAEARSGR